MAGKKQFANASWRYVFEKKGVLDKPRYLTFSAKAKGDEYAVRLEALLARGIVALEHQKTEQVVTIADLVGDGEREAHPSPQAIASLKTARPIHGTVRLTVIKAARRDHWAAQMKRMDKVAPTHSMFLEHRAPPLSCWISVPVAAGQQRPGSEREATR
ncbi:hypothetical protein [Comamonas testosteroni]|uniref:hypothetical protein n=1 Tax=Comamonas testosteroni TaxID=285 RepID=UPI002DB55ECE|nr:hypothetical protein [Comamonas testosteroni]MEB5964730.1 hypothetical protein [Comamonas testosteroni]